jgi:hypothetical protein
MSHSIRIAAALAVGLITVAGVAEAQSDPPGRVGRLAFTNGAVSFHDDQQTGWSPAVVNTPLTSGDAIWTEPNARSELSLAGTRVRLDSGTQLEMLAIDDSQTRLQVDQGRLDINTYAFNPQTPYQIVTPRGTVTLQQQGDYYVEAGSTEDPTRLGVRSGAAQIQSLNGQTLAVRAGEVGEISGDTATPVLRTVNSAPPPPAPYWASRDQQVNYAPPAQQYVSSNVTGYEDLNAYGSWSNDSQYGNVWSPRSVSGDWQPYRTGHWSNVRPWGWTWIDDQPWGYAPYHYGRWANRNNRWMWVPPQSDVQPVYAPALVAFIGGIELSVTLGNQNNGPVGWFPLGPRETYVPSYTANRDYYNRINRSDQVQQNTLDDRWQRTQRHEPAATGPNNAPMNQRFATVVPSDTFVRSQPVARAALKVAPEKLALAPVALVSAPPAPTASIAATTPAPAAKPADPKSSDPKAQADAKARADAQAQAKAGANANAPTAKTAVGDMPTLGRPTATDKPTAPGPKIASAPNAPAGTTAPSAIPNNQSRPATPALVPRTGAAPPQLKDDKATTVPVAPAKPAQPEAKAPAVNSTAPNAAAPSKLEARPATVEPPKPAATVPQQQAKPVVVEPPKAATPPPVHQATPPQPETKAPDKGAALTPARPAAEAPRPQAAPPQQAHAPAPPPLQHPSAAPPEPQSPHPGAAVLPPPPQQQAHAPAPPPATLPVQHATPAPTPAAPAKAAPEATPAEKKKDETK